MRCGLTARTWMWGPEAPAAIVKKSHADAPGVTRRVQYFNKARLEDNSSRTSETLWDVTNSLLVVDAGSVRVQIVTSQGEHLGSLGSAAAGR